MKVLIVDDDPLALIVAKSCLANESVEVICADGGQVGLERIEQQPFDLVLLDTMMPGIDGMEVLRTVRRNHSASDLPIIMATANTKSEDIVEAIKLGANDYVTKPLDFPVVLARVNTQFQLKRATDQLRAAHSRMKRDLEAAARVQQTLLPAGLPESDRAKFAWAYRPCDELAGDSLSVFPLSDGLIGLYVLDVSGHGVPAALLSVTVTRGLLPHEDESALLSGPNSSHEEVSPAKIATNLNARYPMESNGGHYFTLVYGALDTASCELRFVCAGHPGPILTRPGEQPRLLNSPALPIGILKDVSYEDTRVKLQAGDRLYLHSDGLTEETNAAKEQFGEGRLRAAIDDARSLSLQESVDSLIQQIIAWRGDENLRDDVSVLAMEIT